MLTINYKGKTYKPTDAWHFSVQAIVNDLIEKDCLEEVKENKEPTDTSREACLQSIEEDIRYMKSMERVKDTSILEKLREVLYKMKSENVDRSEYTQGVLSTCDYILDLLTPLEQSQTEEEPAEFSDAVKFEIERGCMPCTWNLPPEEAKKTVKEWTDRIDGKVLPQFTPGQEEEWQPNPGEMIEVSQDGDKWEKEPRKFICFGGSDHFVSYITNNGHEMNKRTEEYWKFARPLEQVSLPEYKASGCGSSSTADYCDSRTDEERARDEELYKNSVTTCTSNVWTPTPGQEIECSHTGKEWDWFKEKFTKMVGVNKDLYGVEGEESWYRFARPIEDKIDHDQVKENIRVMDEQDGVKIEPELPAFDYEDITDTANMKEANTTIAMAWAVDRIGEQVERLTTFCQTLSRQKSNK